MREHLLYIIFSCEHRSLQRNMPRKTTALKAYRAIDRALTLTQTHEVERIQKNALTAALCFENLKTAPDQFTYDDHWRFLYSWFGVYLHVCLQRQRTHIQTYAHKQLGKAIAAGRRALRRSLKAHTENQRWSIHGANDLEDLNTAMYWVAKIAEKATRLEVTNAYKTLDALSETARKFGNV